MMPQGSPARGAEMSASMWFNAQSVLGTSTQAHELMQMLREHRLQLPPGDDVIDVLIRRLQVP
jgi:hypothetical protein